MRCDDAGMERLDERDGEVLFLEGILKLKGS